jgi:hypothetical protein
MVKKIFKIISIIIIIFFFLSITSCNIAKTLIEEVEQVEEINEETIEEVEIKEEKISEDVDEIEQINDVETEEEVTNEEDVIEGIEPTIELVIYEGPTYSSAGNVCFYRVKAIVTGITNPKVEFSKDDSNGAWGEYINQVNLYNSTDSYDLIATAINSEGEATSRITLNWGCNEQEEEIQKAPTSSEPATEYFFEIAFGTEYGATLPLIHKWANDIRIKVNGIPTSEDLNTLNQVVTELNSLINSISLQIVDYNQNIDIHFTTMDQFSSIIPSYVHGNMGYFSVWWNEYGSIYYANILISSEKLSQQERSHLIREELTQSLGIMKDSNRYKDSIFFQGWTNTINYIPIDRTIISLLYDFRIKPNMSKDQVKSILGIS